jgi:ribonuclease G
MSKEIYISSTPHETRLAIVENDALAEIYYERENEYTLAGSIYNGRVTRVLPGMQSSFVDIGLERDAFLYITDFMEEAEDPAEFDASAEGSRPRAGNGERGGRDRGDRPNGGRNGQPRSIEPPAAEPTDADLFAQAVSGLDPARPAVIEGERADRSDRGRRGGRNRRNRGGNRDAARPETPRPQDLAPEIVEPVAGNISIPDDPEEIGEGLPGADGSRRWRGRRGRRGNRGARPEGVALATPVSATGPVYDAYPVDPEPDTFDAPVDLEAAATPPRPEQPTRDRGGRGRDRNDGRRAPRGFAPSADLYQVEPAAPRYGSEPEVPEAPVEPIILPGESLSKYRAGGEPASTIAKPAASTEDTFVAQGWDGGLVLPGETIRPRTAPPSFRNDGPRESRSRENRDGRDGRGGRDRGGREGFRADRPARREPFTPAIEPVAASEPVETYLTEPEQVSASYLVTPIDSTFVPPPPVPVAEVEQVAAHEVIEAPPTVEAMHAVAEPESEVEPELEETTREYEPEEASASYRVDPAPPREFRQASPAVEEPVEELAEERVEELAKEPHQFTAISETGNMFSEPAELSPHELPAQEEPEPVAQEATESAQPLYRAPYFEPGPGVLEEEVLEDEDEPLVIAAQSAVEYDPHEQESLEHAADLGQMIRDLSIDELTRVPASLDDADEEDEDFEEDFLEEDRDFAGEEEEEEEDEELSGEFAEDDSELHGGLAEPTGLFADVSEEEAGSEAQPPRSAESSREPRRDRNNDRSRRDGRGRDRNRRPASGDRDRSGERSGSRHEGGRSRQSMQATNLPAISDLLKPGQEILVQIAKEPIAKKGARITSHIALPGRFLVFMPTVSHTGVSRKIESDAERRRLKEILLSEKGEASGGFIVRTAAAGASEEELRSDLRFLLNLWSDIKARSESSKSPALIYHDLNLIERVLRDQVTDNFSAIWVDSETEYERVLRFLQRFQPSLIRRVKLYSKETPMYEQFGITEEINKALRSKVWLKSGGSIVINQTEALVAIDINTGKFVGKTARLEDTIVKTNLDAIPEIVRQIRLRDLGGIIIIDFIDMDERKNRNRVMAALEEELKLDRAPSKVLQFNDFGLVAITRKRVKQSLERTLSTTCGVCQGTGMVKSPVTVCNDIYVEMKKMARHLDRGDVMLRVHPEVVKQLKAPSTHWLQEMEEMCGKTILVKSDPSLHPEQFDIH